MKQTMKNAVIGLFTILAVTTGFTAFANGNNDSTPAAELKLVGRADNQPVFQLNLNNKENEKFVVVVKDEYGVILHQEVISGVNLIRKYQLNTEELDGVGVIFEVISSKTSKMAVFNIKNNTRVINETAIVKN
jgi:hypothetical protein